MRLRKLNLERYGHFTDFCLDFGQCSKDTPDFHIIYGDNEAGKSTTFNGYLDLLFGIEERSRYKFLHEYKNLRISAVLESDQGTLEFARVKGRRSTLLGLNDQPMEQEILTAALQGLSRETYQMMFSLDEETLEQGGKEILASKGDLGRLLFAGAAGVIELTKELEKLQERADKIYAPAKRSPNNELYCLKQELKKIEEEEQRLDTQVSAYKLSMHAREKAEEAYKAVNIRRDALRSEHAHLNRLKTAFPLFQTLREFESNLTHVQHLPDMPNHFVEEERVLQRQWAAAEKTQSDAEIEMVSHHQQLESLVADPLILALESQLTSLDRLALHDQIACKQLPNLREELIKAESKLHALGQEVRSGEGIDLDSLVVSEEMLNQFEERLKKQSKLIDSLSNAKKEESDAEEALRYVQEQEIKVLLPDEKIRELIALSNRHTEMDLQQHLEQAEKALEEKKRKIDRELKKVPAWKGGRQEIASQNVPLRNQAVRWRQRESILQKELVHQKTRQTEHTQRLISHLNKVEAFKGQVGLFSDSSALQLRQARQAAWATHRRVLDEATADAFEEILSQDDHMRDKRLEEVDRLAELRNAEIALKESNAELESIVSEMKRSETALQVLREEIEPVLASIGLPLTFQAEDLPEWLDQVERVREFIEEEEEAQAICAQAKQAYEQRRTLLLTALSKVGEAPSEGLDLRTLEEVSKTYQNTARLSEERHALAKEALQQARAQLQRRKNAVETKQSELKAWQIEWESATCLLWFGQKSIDQIRVLLPLLRKLEPLLTSKKKLIDAIRAKENDSKDFREGVLKLTRALELEEPSDITAHFAFLQRRWKAAKEIEARRNLGITSFQTAEKRFKQAQSDLARITARIKQMGEQFSPVQEILSLDYLASILDKATQKRELTQAASKQERHLLEHLEVATRVEAESTLQDTTLSAIENRLNQVDEELQEIDQEYKKRIEEQHDALRAINALQGDASVALLKEKRESILLEISNKAKSALALHLGLRSANRALLLYRDRHRSGLLAQTAAAFQAITAGEFSGLATRPDQTGDQLLAIRSHGGSIAADEMSKGTRFQLYFALRLAGYRQFCNSARALPFIGDDIMETFDDNRSASVMRQLSQIASVGQVLYFTHHRHLCDIAKNACGSGVTIHEIPKKKAV